jgi:glutathione S-transferase
MAVKLHRCSLTWLKTGGHSCWRVEQALQEKGIDYEVVKEPGLPKSRRKQIIEKTGQTALPVLELEDGRWIREESADLAAKIRAGELP